MSLFILGCQYCVGELSDCTLKLRLKFIFKMLPVQATIKPTQRVQQTAQTLKRTLLHTHWYVRPHAQWECFLKCLSGSLTNEESETKSLGVSGTSGCSRESQESDAGVRGRGLKALGIGDTWHQELMQTRASAASKSLYSDTLHEDCSLSCLLLSRYAPWTSSWAPWETQEDSVRADFP